ICRGAGLGHAAGVGVAEADQQAPADDVAGDRPGQVPEQVAPVGVALEDAEAEDRHVGDEVLEAGGDEGEQGPPQHDQLGPVPAARPCSMYITFPVNSSAPAKTTRVRAMPNTDPCTSLVAEDFPAARGPATLSSRTTATPTKAPAKAAFTMYLGRRRTCCAL